MNENKKSLLFLLSIFLFVASMLAMLLVLCIPVKAASPSGEFPYVVPLYSDLNSSIPADIYLQADSLVRQTYNLSDDDTVIWYIDSFDIVVDELGEYGQNSLTYLINPSTRGYSDSFDYLSSSVNVNFQAGGTIEFRWSGSVRGPYGMGGGTKSLLGSISSSSITHGSITRLYPFYMSGPDVLGYPLQDGGNDPIATIFTNYVPVIPDEFQTGHAIEPSFDNDTIIDSSLHPNVKPTFPTFNTYNITNYSSPSIDTSSVEALLESLIDVVIYNATYLVSNIVGAIQNFWDNLGDMLEYIGDLLSYLFNKVINTIKQTADNLYQNFKDLFEPVLNSFANLINIVNSLYVLGLEDDTFNFGTLFVNLFVPDEEDLNVILSGTREYTFITDISSFLINWLYFVDDVIEEDSIYEIHISSFEFAGTTIPAMTISFDWYIPIKPTIDAIISAFLIFGYGWWLFTRLAGLFHGQAPDSKVVSSLKE